MYKTKLHDNKIEKNRTRYIIKLMFFSLINGHDEDLQILTDIPP